MKIAVIGAGHVGSALGAGWVRAGHEVVFGVREPHSEKAAALPAPAALPAEAVVGAEVVLLATPWPATEAVLASLGDLTGKVLLDATNPLNADHTGLTHGHTTSGGEQVAAWAPGARVVKIFNTTGAQNMANPSAYTAGSVVLFYCGDDPDAKQIAHTLAAALGLDPIDAGPLSQARLLEPYALLWISLAYRHGLGPGFALHLMRR